jgi:hypothetical protein
LSWRDLPARRAVIAFAAALFMLPAALRADPPDPRVVHVFVALCDNLHQGIVPVPAHLGNGEDLKGNLYWGAAYGVKTFFSRSAEWKRLAAVPAPGGPVLERVVFRHRSGAAYLVADAYRGSAIREATVALLEAAAGRRAETLTVEDKSLSIGGAADLPVYVGHDGLMDFTLDEPPQRQDERVRPVILLACASREYFREPLRSAGARPLLWTTGLMAPEAYTLAAALEGWIQGESDAQIQERAAAAYHAYQKCGLRAARRLLVTGW